MKHGFIHTAIVMPKVKVADCRWNAVQVIRGMKAAAAQGARVIALPELCLTGYTCGDLFWQETLLRAEEQALREVVAETRALDAIVFFGCSFTRRGKLYNVMAVASEGRLLGLVPKMYIPNYNEFYEKRHFTGADDVTDEVSFTDLSGETYPVPFGKRLLFACRQVRELVLAAEVCEDLWAPCPPSTFHALAGATILVNSSASDEVTGKDAYRRMLVAGQSGRLLCGYLYATCGEGESTQDLVFGGQSLIAENGRICAEHERFADCGQDGYSMIMAVLDVQKLAAERRRNSSFTATCGSKDYRRIEFSLTPAQTGLSPAPARLPFVPSGRADWEARCEEILSIQSMGLKKRLEHTGANTAVIGISGGLDSTLALLVTVRAFDRLGLPRAGITAITMPGFGTTDRTWRNACHMVETLGASLREIPIAAAVREHFSSIGHEESVHDVTYENSQARERTQILMDVANQVRGLVIGTGDMSELALGWATYNGDHMSMYGVNAGVPKTLVRHLVRYYALTCGDEALEQVLLDVLDTPVSPELLPPKEGEISQKTEDLVGPYELHDFFLYYMLRFGFSPAKIYRMALQSFDGEYDGETILKWLRTFCRRFFSQQFKRSCLPDGPKVGSVAVSPRGDLRMPSDACASAWLAELDEIE